MKSRTNKLALFAMTAGIKAPARLAAHQALGKQIGKFMSEVLVLGIPDEDGEVVLLAPDKKVPVGGRMY